MQMRFALIGCGSIASRHAAQMRKWGRIVAVCDILPERMDIFVKQDGCNAYLTANQLFEKENNLDLVSICTPNHMHAENSIMALHHGVHVLCEKPLALYTVDGIKMIQTAVTNNRSLFVVKQNRYNPPIIALKEAIDSGRLGRIHSFQINCFWNRPAAYYMDNWRGKRDTDGGILYTQFSHFIDVMQWMLGDVKTIHAITQNYMHPDNDIEDAGVIALEMQSGAIGTLNFNVIAFQQNMEGSFTVFGEKGTVKIGGQYLNTLEYQMMEGEPLTVETNNHSSNDYGFYRGSMSNHDRVYADVVHTLQGDECGVAEGDDGLKTISIIERIYKAAGIGI